MRILVTGASGFVGRAACTALSSRGFFIRRAIRSNPTGESNCVADETSVIGNMASASDWTHALSGISTVLHLAARTHVMRESAQDPLAEYRRDNVAATAALARAAVGAGVRRFVYMSSIKVNGERTYSEPFSESSIPHPEDAYGTTKWEAEQALSGIAQGTGLETVILRPPLIYGPGVKGNFLRLMRWVANGVPLPLASVNNRRSLIYLGNLVDAIIACMEAPAAAGKTYLLSDGLDVSTPDLIRSIAAAMGVAPRLFPCPVSLLSLGAGVLGKSAEFRRLTGSLQIDASCIQRDLAWQPRITLPQGLIDTARWYHSQFSGNSST